MNAAINEAIRAVGTAEAELGEETFRVNELQVEAGRLVAGGRRFELKDAGLERLCKRLGAPAHYLSSLDATVASPVLQYHLERGDLGKGRITLVSRNGTFVAFRRIDLTRLAAEEVIRAVASGIGNDTEKLYVGKVAVSSDAFELDLLCEEVSEEVRPGDIVRAGVRVTHSLIGEYATQIESYLLRLLCSNGMTHRECAGRRAVRTRRLAADHPDARRLQVAQIGRLTADVWGKLAEKLAAFRSLREEQIDVPAFLECWLGRARLSARNLMPILRQAWQEEGRETTAYGAVNALTRVATHNVDLPVRQRQILSRLAGLVSFRGLHICPRCFSLLAGAVPD